MQRACWKSLVFALALMLSAPCTSVVLAQPADNGDQPADPDAAPKAPPPPPTLEDSPLLKQPETPEGNFDAALLMVKLARPELAKLYLDKVLDPEPTDELLLGLHDKHGPAVFIQLSNILELRPQSTDLLERVTAAFRRRGADQQRIVALIGDLNGTAVQREGALTALRNAGPVVVPQLLLQFEQIDDVEERALLLTTLTRMGPQIVPAMLGTLESPNQTMRTLAIEVLGWLKAREAIPYLWYPAFAPDQTAGVQAAARTALGRILSTTDAKVAAVSSFGVVRQLQQIALSHYRGEYRWEQNEEGTVTFWTWLPESSTIGERQLSPEAASLYAGMRFAQQALALSPDDPAIQTLYLGFAFAADRNRVGWDSPLPTGPGTTHDLALTLGEEIVSAALTQALEQARPDVAIACLQVLSQTAARHQILYQRLKSSPTIAALDYPDPRVQFAAAATVLQIDPEEPFRSSSRIVSILTRALMDDGKPGALLVHTNAEKSRELGAYLGQMGFEPHIALTGQAGFHAASERSDISLILLEINTIRWGLSQTIANLRADTRTAGIPIVIFGPNEMQRSVAGLLDRYSRVAFIVTPANPEAMIAQVAPFLASFKSPELTAEQRAARRQSAAYWLAHIASGRRQTLFDLAPAETALIDALNDPDLAVNALVALAAISTKTVQQQLAFLAASENADVRLRESAALQLTFHVLRFGALLDEKDVLALREGWAASPEPSLSTALAAVLGTLKPDSIRIGERLSNFPAPAVVAPSPAAEPAPE